jgi:hypothetical protein
MTQQTARQYTTKKIARPRRRDVFFHGIKTVKFIGSLIKDPRIHIVRKILFFSTIIILLAILAFPDFFEEVGLSIVLPLIGTLLGVPLDAGFDWIAFALVVVSLLRIFPAEIVGEHYQQIFGKKAA